MTKVAVAKIADQSPTPAPAAHGSGVGDSSPFTRDARILQHALERNLQSVRDLVEDLRTNEAAPALSLIHI